MKRSIFFILMSITIISAKAQNSSEKTLSFATTIGIGIPISTPSFVPFTWQVLGYYNLTEKWAVGAGSGLLFYDKMLIPLYGDLRYQIGRGRKFTPFAEVAIGYSLAPSDDANGGFLINPSVGIHYPLKNKMKLQLAVGYESQAFTQLKRQTDNYFLKESEEYRNQHSFSLKMGLVF